MPVSYDLSGQVAVVTGGAKGIGRAVAERLRDAGAAVWVWDIAPAELDGIRFVAVDVTSADQIARAVAQVVDETSRIDILVNNAGYLPSASPFEQLDPESWKRVVAVNLMGMLEASRQALPYLRRADKGRIVNLGSLAGKEGLRNLSVYSAASAGVIAFTKALGRELADTPIRVNCVAPGPIDTDLIRDLGPGTVDAMIAASPMKRLGTVGEAAELILWLCSDACSFSTGAVFDLSGGPGRVLGRGSSGFRRRGPGSPSNPPHNTKRAESMQGETALASSMLILFSADAFGKASFDAADLLRPWRQPCIRRF
ncbi:MAG: SDR family NAD(P)-dependent oxidoreductase [Microvirga sp.]